MVIGGILLAFSVVTTASAQDQPATPDPGDASAQVDTSAAESPEVAEAMERFADANAMFERGDRAGALSEMQRVYELLEGNESQYVVLYNLGRVYEELFQYDRAIEAYQRYVAESPEDAEDRADAQASLRALERLLGTIVITTNAPSASVWIGDQEVGSAPGELRIPSGHHALELRAPGFESVRREIDVAARSRLELDIPLTALSDFHGVSPAIFVTTTSLAVVALGVAIGLGVNAVLLSNDAAACGTTPGCQLDVPGRAQSIRDFALAADVTYGVAGLFGVASVVLAFLTDWGGRPDAAPTAPTARLMPTLGGGVLTGTF
jgi:tetratricopeptide (TPR) repeat protein